MARLSETERDLVLGVLDGLRRADAFALFGYVIMPDHAHLLLWPKTVSLVRIMRDVKSKSGYALAKGRSSPGSIWQRSYFDFICRRAHDFSEKLDYIHQNAVAARYVPRAQDWKWSSYVHYAKLGEPPIQIDFIDFSGDPNELLWPAPWRSR